MSRIRGIGIDIVEIGRIRQAMQNPRFLARVLLPEERRPVETAEWVAGRWAAKEAVAKALGTHLGWHDVMIATNPNGKPEVGYAKGVNLDSNCIHLSISHEREYATAMVVVETVTLESDTI